MYDEEFLKHLRQRDPEALSRLVHENTSVLLRAALGLGLPLSDAEELVQATFAAFLEAAPRFEGRSSPRTFLFGILYNKALEHGRKKSREAATDPADAVFESRFGAFGHWSRPPKGPDAEADVNELAALIAQCLDGLTPPQKAAFQLKEVEGEDNEAVCNALDVSGTHLRVLLFRARAKLRECLESKWKDS